MRTLLAGIALMSACALCAAGDLHPAAKRPSVEAVRTPSAITIDGILNEQVWQRPGMDHFTQRDPVEGSKPTERTEVWVAYDDEALYVAARMYDTAPESIMVNIGRRDADLNADWFYVGIDAYHDRRTGFYFTVYASGSVIDGTLYNDDWDNNTWDGVWDAATKIDSAGWTAELKIPYSQLRFSQQDDYVWGIDFVRQIERKKERDDFVFVPKKESGWVSRFADLLGLRHIHPPRRLEILPYAASTAEYLQHDPRDPFNDGSNYKQNFGADLKVGLGSNLTMNATVNPDFGQVEVDPAVVNLSQYETFFDEKRPFFVEGSDLFEFGFGGANSNWGFNWGSPSFFYSRRIGRPPQGSPQHTDDDNQHDVFHERVDPAHIIGAAKLTGKVADEWSLASVQALTARANQTTDSAGVRFDDVVEPLSYYGVVRSLKEFNEGHQAVGIIGTAVMRDLNKNYLVDNFNRGEFVLGMDGWTNLDSAQAWVVTGWLASSLVRGTSDQMVSIQESPIHNFQRPDADYLGVDPNSTSLAGYAGRVALNKQKGNTYLNAAFGIISPRFESNDLGFMFRTDVINSHIVLGYRWYDPDGTFRSKNFNIATFRNFNYAGQKTGEGYFFFYNAELMNYWNFSGTFQMNPATLDPYNTRGGPIMKNTNGYGLDIYGSTDSRDEFIFDCEYSAYRTESGGWRISTGPGLTWKPTSGLNFRFSPYFNRDITIAQWVDSYADSTAAQTFGSRYLFGRLDLHEISATIRLDWTFTPKLTLQLYLQPLISVGTYTQFKALKQPGTYTFNGYGVGNGSTVQYTDSTGSYTIDADGPGGPSPAYSFSNPDFNFKSLRGNAVLRWEYLPGSTLYFVWTHQRTNGDDAGDYSFGRDFHSLLTSPGDNVFLIKATYWWNP